VIVEAVRRDLGGDGDGEQTVFLDIGDGASHITAGSHGLADLFLEPGETVEAGAPAATIRDVHRFGAAGEALEAPRPGVVVARRRNPLVKPGDHLYLVAEPVGRDRLVGS